MISGKVVVLSPAGFLGGETRRLFKIIIPVRLKHINLHYPDARKGYSSRFYTGIITTAGIATATAIRKK